LFQSYVGVTKTASKPRLASPIVLDGNILKIKAAFEQSLIYD
jgi:hypothetical protein